MTESNFYLLQEAKRFLILSLGEKDVKQIDLIECALECLNKINLQKDQN